MHFQIECSAGLDDRAHGWVMWEGLAEPLPFSGWLELLRLLEEAPLRAGGDPDRPSRVQPTA